MTRKTTALIISIVLALITLGVERYVDNTPHPNLPPQGGKEQEETTFPLTGEGQGGGEVYDSSRIWTKGPMGNAAANATAHFKKHGAEFGFKTEQDYIAAAVKFTTEPVPDGVLKNIQKDGDTAYYNPKTAEYAVKSKQGFIRTYFKLNPKIHGYATNTDYFNAQAAVGAQRPANDNRP